MMVELDTLEIELLSYFFRLHHDHGYCISYITSHWENEGKPEGSWEKDWKGGCLLSKRRLTGLVEKGFLERRDDEFIHFDLTPLSMGDPLVLGAVAAIYPRVLPEGD